MGPIDLTPPGVPAPYSRQDRVAAGGCFWIMTEQTDLMLFSLARVINPQKQPSAGVEKKDRKTCAVLVEAVPRFKVLRADPVTCQSVFSANMSRTSATKRDQTRPCGPQRRTDDRIPF
ncbi:hypothetical protein CGMCC3_g628 [Colletotrichum fructicola]|nr:uncharacterized protein CGMCC3_g628 [Colletotrichum fructicola]KAE9583550.1 hypothetical protein CGMCC3_g628 [Colletotrichum fructicola]